MGLAFVSLAALLHVGGLLDSGPVAPASEDVADEGVSPALPAADSALAPAGEAAHAPTRV
jgi:hypothetical protein